MFPPDLIAFTCYSSFLGISEPHFPQSAFLEPMMQKEGVGMSEQKQGLWTLATKEQEQCTLSL